MSLKKGFTLFEILITTAILGIVATLTIPQLAHTLNNRKNCAALSNAIKEIELGSANIFDIANSNIATTGSTGDRFSVFTQDDLLRNYSNENLAEGSFDILAPYLNLEPVDLDSNIIFVNNYNGSTALGQALIRNSYNKYRLAKRQTFVYIQKTGNIDPELDDTFAVLFIDTNGLEQPNSLGRDIFRFRLTNGGKMIPHGLEAGDYYTTNCTDNYIKDGLACAARVVKDGFKINY